ncbi:TSUP family transporter [Cyanobium sp. BA20m-14]|uniref:TSUP family transporter n=1 Tax=Cyanobium sp. BA20m-14 TaxID=2823703 RepID=UPI0020CE098F|nr:TSUP family transporter [Cyanobium sp. BA20m-14]
MTLWLPPLLALVAFLYAAVGHAGASGYIAVLALAGLPAEQIKPLALILNTAVAAQGSWQFVRAGHLRWRLFWPMLLAGLPMAFLGALARSAHALVSAVGRTGAAGLGPALSPPARRSRALDATAVDSAGD